MIEAEKEAKEKTKRVIKVPKGTSEYQAAWIMDKPGMATHKIKIYTSEFGEKFQNFPIKIKVFLLKLKVSGILSSLKPQNRWKRACGKTILICLVGKLMNGM